MSNRRNTFWKRVTLALLTISCGFFAYSSFAESTDALSEYEKREQYKQENQARLEVARRAWQKKREEFDRQRIHAELAEKRIETEAKQAIIEERKAICSTYGFVPSTDGHAKCVMQLSIEAEANERQQISDSSIVAAIAKHTAASTAAAAANTVRETNAATAAAEAAAGEARRQRQAQTLINLGAAISSGGVSTTSSNLSPTTPLSSGRYKTCRYRVAGEIFPMTVGRAELCPATRSIGGQTGYLVR